MPSAAFGTFKVPLIPPSSITLPLFGCVLLLLFVDNMTITGNDQVGI